MPHTYVALIFDICMYVTPTYEHHEHASHQQISGSVLVYWLQW